MFVLLPVLRFLFYLWLLLALLFALPLALLFALLLALLMASFLLLFAFFLCCRPLAGHDEACDVLLAVWIDVLLCGWSLLRSPAE